MMIINNNNDTTTNNNNDKLHKNCVFFILQKQSTEGISRKRSENLSKIDEK